MLDNVYLLWQCSYVGHRSLLWQRLYVGQHIYIDMLNNISYDDNNDILGRNIVYLDNNNLDNNIEYLIDIVVHLYYVK
jgi:hypothetical protein